GPSGPAGGAEAERLDTTGQDLAAVRAEAHGGRGREVRLPDRLTAAGHGVPDHGLRADRGRDEAGRADRDGRGRGAGDAVDSTRRTRSGCAVTHHRPDARLADRLPERLVGRGY